jgi:hypothetical protein
VTAESRSRGAAAARPWPRTRKSCWATRWATVRVLRCGRCGVCRR